jgi:hypothetical protein
MKLVHVGSPTGLKKLYSEKYDNELYKRQNRLFVHLTRVLLSATHFGQHKVSTRKFNNDIFIHVLQRDVVYLC